MFIKSLVVMGAAIAASVSLPLTAIAQSLPPTVNIGGKDYEIEFKLGVFEDHIVELQAQPWYSKNDFALAAETAQQVFDCAEGSPFAQPICQTPFDTFGLVNTGFGGISPWFVYDVEAGVAGIAVGFSDVADGGNVLSQIAADLESQQSFAIVATAPSVPDATTTIPEPMSWLALLAVGAIAVGSRWVNRH
ncbi:hypothetical protein [Leptolyngbya iicbica]|uniref:PEP-CTERM sorting domain-containing protein n=2 Tax=Cyanophyceae TaxID=3028117 RepID=A0A4V2E2L4_9CYAN|nr:hypothetical protein [Leptolyngbya sp. LK]RZM78966.1 hypothetical protein DYY88_09310 [Leptolyngbya sp. LK]